MIQVTFNTTPAFLLDDQPNWSAGLQVDASIPASYERGLSGRETRRATGDTLRLAMKFSCNLTSSVAVTNLRNSLQDLNVQTVLCPFWPGVFAAGVTPPLTAAYYYVFNADGSYNSIQPAANLPFALFACPLMVGILAEVPDPSIIHDNYAVVDYKFTENDVYPLTPAPFAPPAGIAAASGVRPLFPWRANWSSPAVSGEAEVDLDRKQVGQLRQMSSAYYAQPGRRKVSQAFTLCNSDPVNLLAFFVALAGEQNNFWLPAALSEASLTQNVLTTDTALHVDNAGAIGSNTFIILDDLNHRVPLVITGTAGSAWNLSGAVGTAFNAAATRIESLVLARFDVLKISLAFTDPTLATVTLKFKETPWETAAVAGETINVTQGALPVTAMLYVFTINLPTGAETSYFTNFERNLTDGTNTYLSAPIENEPINETATLDRQSVKLTARNFTGNPLALLVPMQLEFPLNVDIYEADVTGSNVPTLATLQAAERCFFSGEVSSAETNPPFIVATCETLSSIFDRQIPRRLYQQTDNWCLFETANGLTPADWQWNAVVVSYDPTTNTLIVGTLTQQTPANTLADTANALVAHWFSAGYLVITAAAGGAQQARMISDNTAVAGGHISLYLSTPLTNAPTAGDVVNLFPGNDGQSSTAITKFNNYLNFGGFPFMPIGNPTVLKITQQAYGGGKK
jgi:hypothetical protein